MAVHYVEETECVEFLDHHRVGSIETTVPVTATFDTVGSTATLVIERFRQNGMEPSRASATVLLGALLSDTVVLSSPTTTERDRSVVDYLERVLAVNATGFGREIFKETSDVSSPAAEKIISRDAKDYDAGRGKSICMRRRRRWAHRCSSAKARCWHRGVWTRPRADSRDVRPRLRPAHQAVAGLARRAPSRRCARRRGRARGP